MTRSDAWGVAQTVHNEIVVLLAKAGYEGAAEYIASREIKKNIREISNDLADY